MILISTRIITLISGGSGGGSGGSGGMTARWTEEVAVAAAVRNRNRIARQRTPTSEQTFGSLAALVDKSSPKNPFYCRKNCEKPIEIIEISTTDVPFFSMKSTLQNPIAWNHATPNRLVRPFRYRAVWSVWVMTESVNTNKANRFLMEIKHINYIFAYLSHCTNRMPRVESRLPPPPPKAER